jgi:geranylgeranylglycerol-phosphate geranylgeranyltransferase
MSTSPAKGLFALLRMPYWLMTGGLSLLTAFAITKSMIAPQQIVLIFLSMAFITSAGFAINDFFDRESDAVIKPKRPIPAGALTLKQVIAISSILFTIGLIMSYFVNGWISFTIIATDSLLLLLYSYLVKRRSGFAANILVGILTGTAFIYGQVATVQGEITLVSLTLSLSLYPIAFGTIGGNVLRDILSLEGDSKVGYPTLPKRVGSATAAKVGALFFMLTGLLAPLPYFIVKITGYGFSVYYLPLILLWSVLLIYSSLRLATSASTIQNIRKYERMVTMSMILLPLALIVETIAGILL